jgi:uncharacterized membrane protein
MIPAGPRTTERRARAAAMRDAWEALSPETRRILAEMPRADRQRVVRAVADGKQCAPIAVGEP